VGALRSIPLVAFASSAAEVMTPVVFAVAPAGASKPDDIIAQDGIVYVTYQNNAGKDGSPAGSKSTVLALDRAGTLKQSWSVPGRVDGLTADPRNGRIFATANEDLNSSLFLITPASKTLQHLTFSPDPAQKGSDGSNGGTDSVWSAPMAPSTSRTPTPTRNCPPRTIPPRSARCHPRCLGQVDAVVQPQRHRTGDKPGRRRTGERAAGPDRSRFQRIIASSGGDMPIQDAQADSKLVFATHRSSGSPSLAQLNLVNAGAKAGGPTPQLDDIEQVTGPGTLYVVDQSSGKIYSMDTAAVTPGTSFVSQPKPSKGDLPNHAGRYPALQN